LAIYTPAGDIGFCAIDIELVMTKIKNKNLPLIVFKSKSDGVYNNFYLQTYNWNVFSPVKIPNEFMDQYNNQEIKNKKEHKEFYYVG
jgi:hypothetical protein